MKKKLLMAILLFSILLGGCGNSGDSSPAVVDNTNTWEDDTEYEETDTDYEEDIYEEPEEVVLETYPFTKLRPFSEERAWVDFNKDGITHTGIIDTDGKLLYESEGGFSYVSQFVDGTAFYRKNVEKTSPCGIIDLAGNVLFESQISPDGGYLILAYGNGHFLVAQHIQNFETDEWRYGTIDKDGNILNEMKKGEINFGSFYQSDWESKYIGENFMALPTGVYNIETSVFSYFPYFPYSATGADVVISDFYDGNAIFVVEPGLGAIVACVIDTNFEAYRNDDGDYQGFVSRHDINELSIYSKGLIWNAHDSEEAGYYDRNWNLVVSLEKYRDKDIKGGPFGDGYAAVTLRGEDGYRYASAVDQSGNLAYDPVKIDSGELNDSANGYFQVVIDDEEKIISPDGAIYTPGIDDLSMLKELTFGDVSGGFIIMSSEENNSDVTPYYVSLDANTLIDSVKVTSADMDIVEDESWSDETSEDSSYIVPDSYDITGKWKSVGDSGFGQAQPGAIVVFDGNNCNFYSPKDTYAFYKEDDRYVLDITSVLGESLIQTVNIIDDDNIEIAGASLRRIE